MSTYFNGDIPNDKEDDSINPISRFLRYYVAIFDKIQFYFIERWVSVGVLSILYIFRLIYTRGKLKIMKFLRLSCRDLLPWDSYTEFTNRIYFPSK